LIWNPRTIRAAAQALIFCVTVLLSSCLLAQRPPPTPAELRGQRIQRFLAGRRGSSRDAPQISARQLLRARLQHQALGASPQIIPQTTPLNTGWVAVGPQQIASQSYGNVTGRITSIAIDPTDATGNTVYLGTTGGGVWKSTNAAGVTASVLFTPLTDTLSAFDPNAGASAIPSLSIGAITVQPGGTNVVLAGTGDPNDALDSYYGVGILRSADGGLTWSLIQSSHDGVAGNHSFTGEGFAAFAWSTTTPNLVVAAVSQAEEGVINNAAVKGASVKGLYYSSDAGVTWKMATISDGSQIVQWAQTSFSNYDGNAATAAVWDPIRKSFFAAVRYHGYYQSTDGINWLRLANQPGTNLTTANCPVLAGLLGSQSCPIFRGALAAQSTTGDLFALSTDVNNLDQGLWQDVCALSGQNCASSTVAFATRLTSTPLESGAGSTVIAQADYDLWLAALPITTGSSPDTLLLAGTEDIFRCTLASGCILRNTTNVNTCKSAMVASSQHAVASGQGTVPVLYFGNDGGLWRSTDEVNQQASVCSSDDAAHYQNLNSGLGSLAEIVSFAQSTASTNTLLAGVGANGTAGTSAAATQSAWPQLSAGDGGYTAMDTTNPLNWYISTGAGVSINLCTNGAACTAASFAVSPTIGYSQTSSDASLIDAPFLLDPQAQSDLILGTCRVWRGPGSGGNLWSTSNDISPMLGGPQQPACETNNAFIRSLAAGGAVAGGSNPQNAGSEVLYAGMAGLLDGGGLAPGHLFTTASGNTANSGTVWSDRWNSPVTNDASDNEQFNPANFDISSIAADTHDSTGNTVYATVMGFNYPHVYRSTDAGAHWTAISGNLPNAPANSVIVDPNDANTVYVAMDTGVYITTAVTTCATTNCWSIYGTSLPNAPVIQLAAVTGAGAGTVTGLLRAGTYGRGIWQIPLATAVPQTAMQLAPTSLTFAGQQVQTASAALPLTVTNTGSTALNISSITAGGDFTETNNCIGATIAAGTTCTVQVSFTPTATGARAGTLTVYGNVSGGQATAALTGTGLAPASITLLPLSMTFPATLVGTTSAAMYLTVNNNGGVTSQLQTPVVSGDFTISANTCGTSLGPNSGCTISIEFVPTAAGARTGTFSITDSAGTQTATLNGMGTLPATDTLTPLVLTFATQQINTTSAAQQVTLTNTGSVALTLITAQITSGDFISANGCGNSLAANATCGISVSYVPKSLGAETGLLTVGDVQRTQTVILNGTSIAPPGVSLAPAALSFAAQGVTTQSPAQTVTLTNNGGLPLTITTIAISGDYLISSGTCPLTPATLAVNASCTAQIVFAPTVAGARTGTLTFTDNAPVPTQTLLITGTAIDFAWSVNGSARQTITAGQPATFSLELTPVSAFTGQSAALACSGAPLNATCTMVPVSSASLSAPTDVIVTIITGAAAGATLLPGPYSRPQTLWFAALLPLLLLPKKLRMRCSRIVLLCLIACACMTGCGWGRLIPDATTSTGTAPVAPTPPGTYTLNVSASDAGLTRNLSLTLIVQ
jgi:hypothetical protein